MFTKKEGEQSKPRKHTPQRPLWKDRTAIILMALTVALAFVFVLILPKFVAHSELFGSDKTDDVVQEEPVFRNPLSGIGIYEEIKDLQLFGVMIDNHEDAWPQSGIEQAYVVIEAPVEAGITRFLAFFSEAQSVDEIGPIRSARPYFLDWNDEFDALFAHVGGSDAALDKIATGGTFDLNQYWHGDVFWRDSSQFAPYNVYTSTTLLSSYVAGLEVEGVTPELLYGTWMFKEPVGSEGIPVDLHIDFWAPVYTVDWMYDVESRRYKREQAGKPHVSASGIQIEADNVVVVITQIDVVDVVGRRKVKTIGEGKAFVLQDGVMIEATWRKPSATERLRFYLDTGEEIKMNAGVTWIEVIPDESSMEFMTE